MKNRRIFTILTTMIVVCSCAKEGTSIPQPVDRNSFKATLENTGLSTRTSITADPGTGYDIAWVKNDTISVNGEKYYADNSGASTVFKVYDQPAEGTEFHAYYPSSLLGTGGATVLPSVQKYGGDGVISNVPAYAYSTSSTLEFKNLCGVLAVKVKKSEFQEIKSIRVSSDQPMCGEFELAEEGGASYAKLKTTALDKVTTLVSEDAVSIGDDPCVFYISIPVGEYTNLRIEPSSDGTVFSQMMSTKTNKEITIERNKVYLVEFGMNTIQRSLDGETNIQL